MELDNTHNQSQLETAKKLVRTTNNLEFTRPTDKHINDVENFGNLTIKHEGSVKHRTLNKLYSNGYAVSAVYGEELFIRPIEGEEQTCGSKARIEEAIRNGDYQIIESKHRDRYEIELL